jgi:hypothetical protein
LFDSGVVGNQVRSDDIAIDTIGVTLRVGCLATSMWMVLRCGDRCRRNYVSFEIISCHTQRYRRFVVSLAEKLPLQIYIYIYIYMLGRKIRRRCCLRLFHATHSVDDAVS